MLEFLVWSGIAAAILGVIWGKIVIAAAREFVKTEHPAGFAAMSGYGTPYLKNFSSEERRVERALAAKMLVGGLPPAVAEDPRFRPIRRSWQTAAAMIFGGLGLVVYAIRSAGG